MRKAKQLDAKSTTYNQIAASIALRYYQGLLDELDFIKLNLPLKPSKNSTIEIINDYEIEMINTRKRVFKYLTQLEVCYEIYPDIEFIKTALHELYGYNGMTWYNRQFHTLFIRPLDDKSGKIKVLKGYIFDFHILISNSDNLFKDGELSPSDLVVSLEKKLYKHDSDIELPIIWVGKINKTSRSPLIYLTFLFTYIVLEI